MAWLGLAALPKPQLGWLFASIASLAVIALVGTAVVSWNRGRGRRGWLRLKHVGTVSGLFIHPVKSCKGVAVKRAEVTTLGLRRGDMRDR